MSITSPVQLQRTHIFLIRRSVLSQDWQVGANIELPHAGLCCRLHAFHIYIYIYTYYIYIYILYINMYIYIYISLEFRGSLFLDPDEKFVGAKSCPSLVFVVCVPGLSGLEQKRW